MEVRVDGSRSTTESWLEAHRIPVEALPPMTLEEQHVAEQLGIPTEEYNRSKYAADLTRKELQVRALHVGRLVENWLRAQKIAGDVQAVWLKTYEGKFGVEVGFADSVQQVTLKEELLDDLLDSGSQNAQQSFDRLLSANFLSEVAHAS